MLDRLVLTPMEINPITKKYPWFAAGILLLFGLQPSGILFEKAWAGGTPFLLQGECAGISSIDSLIQHDSLFGKIMGDQVRALCLILLSYLAKPHGQQRGLSEQVLDLIQPTIPERFVGDIDPEPTEDILRGI